jgi:hypothetical protein
MVAGRQAIDPGHGIGDVLVGLEALEDFRQVGAALHGLPDIGTLYGLQAQVGRDDDPGEAHTPAGGQKQVAILGTADVTIWPSGSSSSRAVTHSLKQPS